jgi:hypothetical protein
MKPVKDLDDLTPTDDAKRSGQYLLYTIGK